jgi:C4-dicarboxylate-specific signal transduction histidine kinase
MARRFDPAAVPALEEKMRMEISVSAFRGEPSGIQASGCRHTNLAHGAIDVHEIDDQRLRATTVLLDLAGNPIVELSAQTPRRIFAQGHRTIRQLLFWQAVSGVLVTLMVILFVRRVILAPIARLNRQVTAIANRSSFSDRLDVTTRDEVGETSQAINQMLAALDAANTKLQAAYDELKATQAQLIQTAKLASIGQLAAGVAHELNQPLMVIRGTAQMIRRSQMKGRLNLETIPIQLNLIERNTKRMMNIIDHLRSFSHQSNRAHAPNDINRVVKDCFVLVGKQLRAQGIDVALALAPNLPKVICDQGQMEQVLLNLITNAQDAILEKRAVVNTEWQGRLEVMTAPGAKGRTAVEIRVRDNGGGIAEDRLDWIFDPFFTTKAVGQGTGLGLSISYSIVQEHKGYLRVEATGPQGTTFAVELPAETDPGESVRER